MNFEKQPVQVQEFRKITHRVFRNLENKLQINKENWKMSTWLRNEACYNVGVALHTSQVP